MRLPAKVIGYRNYKTFDQNEFLQNLNDEQQYDIFTSIFRQVLG